VRSVGLALTNVKRIYIARIQPDDPPILLKHRFSKKYRHASLDSSLTRTRIGAEVRAITRCLKSGIRVPGIRLVDARNGLLGLELIEGKSVRQILPGAIEEEEEEGECEEGEEMEKAEELVDSVKEFGVTHEQIMDMIGIEIAKMHKINVIHGDLTTSNMMVRRRLEEKKEDKDGLPSTSGGESHQCPRAEVLLIDFGLTSNSGSVEDKAVDLYVLERAFASTHPDSEPHFQKVLDAYARESGEAWIPIHRRLEEVRLRGRKRSMVG